MILKETGHVIATARDIVGASGSGLFQKKKFCCVLFLLRKKERKKERERERETEKKEHLWEVSDGFHRHRSLHHASHVVR